MKDRTLAVFDFDGTITRKDSFIEFIKFSCGKTMFFFGFFIHLHLLVLMKLHLYPNWKCKQKIFSWFFSGKTYSDFVIMGERFSQSSPCLFNKHTLQLIKSHQTKGDSLYVISASIEEWVRPICNNLGITNVIGTKVEVNDEGKLTGHFITKNCYGQEKVRRLLENEPKRQDYYLYAYGDSRGDKEMLDFADRGVLLK